MSDQLPPTPHGAEGPPPWPPEANATPAPPPGYPTAPPGSPAPQTPNPAQPTPAKSRKLGIPLAVAAMVLAIGIVIAALLLPDSTSPTVGLPESAAVTMLTPTTVTVNDLAHQPIETTGDSLFTTRDPVGMPAPTITGRSFDDSAVRIDGTEPTVVVVMAHWCPHCQAEIPRIVDAYRAGKLPDGVRVIGVATANTTERGNFPPAAWLDRESWPFAVMVDDEDGTAMHALGVSGFPTIVAIGADGTVRAHTSGENELSGLQATWNAALGAASN